MSLFTGKTTTANRCKGGIAGKPEITTNTFIYNNINRYKMREKGAALAGELLAQILENREIFFITSRLQKALFKAKNSKMEKEMKQ